MKKRVIFICLCLWLLVACSNEQKADELVQEVEKEHDEVNSLESTHTEVYSDRENKYEDVYHFEEDQVKVDFIDAEFTLYIDGENYEMTTTREPSSIQGKEIAIIKKEVAQRQEFNQNPISFYKQFDEDFDAHVDLEEDNGTWTLTYVPEDEVLEDFYTKYTEFMLDAVNIYEGDFPKHVVSNVDINDFQLILTIDQETKRIMDIEFKEDATFLVNENENGLDRTLFYEFDTYNEADAIEVPSDAHDITDGIIHDDGDSNPLEDAFDDVFGDTLEDNPEMEEKAVSYLEGIIQAIVFQDVEKSVNVSQGTMNKEDAEMQQSFFRDVYIENTRANMGDVDVDDKYLENLADAFLSAIGKTSYQVIDTQYDGLEQVVVVTLEVEGIDDAAINDKTEEDLMEVLDENEDLSVDEMVEKNFEILADNYNEHEGLLDPIEMNIPMIIEGENEFYLEPDAFLQGFIQQ